MTFNRMNQMIPFLRIDLIFSDFISFFRTHFIEYRRGRGSREARYSGSNQNKCLRTILKAGGLRSLRPTVEWAERIKVEPSDKRENSLRGAQVRKLIF